MTKSKIIKMTFLRESANILGKSDYTLTTTNILRYFSNMSFKYDIDIPYSEMPLPKEVGNKRNALYENLIKFPSSIQFDIIDELCDNEAIKDHQDVKNLKRLLHERYCK